MQPLGNKILVRDIKEGEKKTEGGLIIPETAQQQYRKVTVEETSWDSDTKLKPGDICLCNPGGVELEDGLWLCNEGLLDCKL
jgi:co-chaperonin GroES (HSP10)